MVPASSVESLPSSSPNPAAIKSSPSASTPILRRPVSSTSQQQGDVLERTSHDGSGGIAEEESETDIARASDADTQRELALRCNRARHASGRVGERTDPAYDALARRVVLKRDTHWRTCRVKKAGARKAMRPNERRATDTAWMKLPWVLTTRSECRDEGASDTAPVSLGVRSN